MYLCICIYEYVYVEGERQGGGGAGAPVVVDARRIRSRGCPPFSANTLNSWAQTLNHPGVELRANLESISHRCHLFEVAFVWELT